MELILKILLVFFLVFLNGFFVASEFSLVTLRRTRITELVKKGKRRAKLIQDAQNNISRYISATQLGITLASLGLGWIGEPAVADILRPMFAFLPEKAALLTSHTLSIIIAFVLITFLHIVLGELTPKTIALQAAEKTSLYIIAPLVLFAQIFRPFIWILNSAGRLVLKMLGFTAPMGHQLVHSEEEIKLILAHSQKEGAIEEQETRMLYNVFKLGDLTVKQIMVPRTEIIAFSVKDSIRRFNQAIKRYPYFSRFPIYKKNLDNIIGFIHVKDLYKVESRSAATTLGRSGLMRKILFMPEIKKADDAFVEMRKKRIHIAIINDEYGGTEGLVTMEDIIESLVGELEDEFDSPIIKIQKQKGGDYLVDGRTNIDAIRSRFHLSLKGQGYTTIGGLIFGLIGREPQIGEKIQLGNLQFIIEKIENKRIRLLRIIRMNEDQEKSKV